VIRETICAVRRLCGRQGVKKESASFLCFRYSSSVGGGGRNDVRWLGLPRESDSVQLTVNRSSPSCCCDNESRQRQDLTSNILASSPRFWPYCCGEVNVQLIRLVTHAANEKMMIWKLRREGNRIRVPYSLNSRPGKSKQKTGA
jgi:hypothetical protein